MLPPRGKYMQSWHIIFGFLKLLYITIPYLSKRHSANNLSPLYYNQEAGSKGEGCNKPNEKLKVLSSGAHPENNPLDFQSVSVFPACGSIEATD